MTIDYRIENGCMVGFLPSFPIVQQRVRLREIARRLARRGRIPRLSGAELQMLDTVAGTEIVGGVQLVGWRFGRRLKKAFKKVAKVAKKIVDNKIVKTAWTVAKSVVPPPYNVALQATESAVRFGTALAKGSSKARELAPVVKAAAEGKTSLPALEAAAVKAKVSPDLARKAAAAGRLHAMAKKGDAKAAAALKIAATVNAVKKGKASKTQKRLVRDLALQSKLPGAATYRIKGRSGKAYSVMVAPA